MSTTSKKTKSQTRKVKKKVTPKKSLPKEKGKEKAPMVNNIKLEIISILLFVLAIFIYISVAKFQGLPEDIEFIGLFGSYIMKSLVLALGEAAIFVAFFILLWSIHIGILKEVWSLRMWGVSLLFLAIVIAIGIYNIPGGLTPIEAGQKGMGGGYIGGFLAYIWTKLLGRIGSLIVLCLSVIVGLLMIINKPLRDISDFFNKQLKILGAKFSDWLFVEDEALEADISKNEASVRQAILINDLDAKDIHSAAAEPKLKLVVPPKIDVYEPSLLTDEFTSGEAINTKEGLQQVLKDSKSSTYHKPPLDLLADMDVERNIDKKNIKDSIAVLEETFSNFGILVKVNQVSCGPTVTRYELTPAKGVKVSRILSLTDDLQLNLAAPGIRIEAPIPGKSAIGIEVPNVKVSNVGLKNLLQSPNFIKLKTPLAFVLGEDITGNTVVARLSDMPHLLIAGSTGSGKSVCLNSIIMSLIFNTSPEELKLVLIDPKMVELTVYNGIPHLLTPVVTNPKKASIVLRWMVTEMEKRYRLFAQNGVRDIARYNQINDDKLPFIIIVIDELADLMMVSPVEVEDTICRLAQMARAAGMHLIVATQRPSVDVVTGIIKANIPSRIAFAVSSQADSRTILDIGGAEKLLGKGDMLFFPVGAIKPYRVQGAYVSDNDIEQTVEYIKQFAEAVATTEQLEEIEASLDNVELEEDELFWEAVNIFVEDQKASVSLLQRRLRIGYARAARLVDIMEDKGIVSKLDNTRRREILIDSEQLEKLQTSRKLS